MTWVVLSMSADTLTCNTLNSLSLNFKISNSYQSSSKTQVVAEREYDIDQHVCGFKATKVTFNSSSSEWLDIFIQGEKKLKRMVPCRVDDKYQAPFILPLRLFSLHHLIPLNLLLIFTSQNITLLSLSFLLLTELDLPLFISDHFLSYVFPMRSSVFVFTRVLRSIHTYIYANLIWIALMIS